jgi:tyrocidine synthetase-3
MNCSIIGLSIRLPEGLDKEGFWKALLKDTSFLNGMSPARQALHKKNQSRSWSKLSEVKGMYLEDIDCFDRHLFKLSNPALMFADPRQRLLLESCWSAIEDAGLSHSALKKQKVGVFLTSDGFDQASYFRSIPENELSNQEFIIPGTISSFLASRISNVLDFKGPSMVIDSTCSSIYVAIHYARQALEKGECDYALVGGATLFIEPWKTGENHPTSFESGVIDIKSFSKNADGYCSSEGCGAILLQRSQEENDQKFSCYGTIIGSGYNSGGKTASYAKPNQGQQEYLYRSVLDASQIAPLEIDYIESHGIGSAISDAIEANAFINVFGRKDTRPCYISTIKPNIGHAQASSGLYSLLKALLSIKYKKILKIKGLNTDEVNNAILKERKGITFLTETIDWPEREEPTKKRKVFLSSYGANNVNAAILVEEAEAHPQKYAKDNKAVLICLSAATKEQMIEQQGRLLSFIKKADDETFSLKALSYTLQVGREPMQYRLVIKIESLKQLRKALKVNFEKPKSDKGIFIGDSKHPKKSVSKLLEDKPSLDQLLVSSFKGGDLDTLARLWVNGIKIKWAFCYQNEEIQRLHLPTYPFSKERYWIPNSKEKKLAFSNGKLHPLLHYNSSTFEEQRFTSVFTGQEKFLLDHQIKGEKVLPGMAYLELARAAATFSIDQPTTQFNNITWLHPISLKGGLKKIYVSLFEDKGEIVYEVYSWPDGEDKNELIHGQGRLGYKQLPPAPSFDIARIKNRLTNQKQGGACYDLFQKTGIKYGASFQGIEALYYNEEESLSKINLPKESGFVLQPGLLDCALQAFMQLSAAKGLAGLMLPYSIKELKLYGDIAQTQWSYIKISGYKGKVPCCDAFLLNGKGEVLAGFHEFILLPIAGFQKIKGETSLLPKENNLLISIERQQLKETATKYFKSFFSSALRLPLHQIGITDTFEKYGIDSIMVNKLNKQLIDVFEDLPSTLFFEFQNLEQLIDYFVEEYPERLTQLADYSTNSKLNSAYHFEKPFENKKTSRGKRNSVDAYKLSDRAYRQGKEPVAIIGLSGRYPEANNVWDFWENLKTGRDSITEIPKDRWTIQDFYDAEKGKAGRSYSKWGGFMEDVDKFDPLFFNISPREAELMDPQERLFLQTVWEAMEDAGYTPGQLQQAKPSGSISRAPVGVYVGVMYEEYQLLGVEESLRGNPLALMGSPASIANRVSYFLNFHGPSLAVDTMCSSSLTAIHLAIEAIYNGSCSMAIAGGVNVSVHPNKYKMLSQGMFVSDKGKCESFGEGGNGYVPSEGVGVVILKRLSEAQADGDQIYGVIKGSSINHGGKTNGYTVPNPNAQAAAIKEAIERAGVKPEDISYVEAHGTGTSLGDPIEIAGLSNAFKNTHKLGQYCAIGSVKSNIGHAESAAGIAGLTKILLQFKHQQLVPSLHSGTLNQGINFEKTSFKVQQELEDWVIENNKPRIAGISSFGAGGSNAHIIIEEFTGQQREYQPVAPAIIVLSAKNADRLKEQVANLSTYLNTNESINLYDLAYTLQVGRVAMEERLAFVASGIEELINHLNNYQKGIKEGLFTGNIENGKTDHLIKGGAGKAYINYAIENKESENLAQLWVIAVSIDWTLLYEENNRPNKISLPTYPFARDRYWIPESKGLPLSSPKSHLHPLLHSNVSDFEEQKYQSIFIGDEAFLTEHRVKGKKLLPGVAYLELAREAGAISLHRAITQFKDIIWLNPVEVNGQPKQIQVSLFEENNLISYEIYSQPEGQEEIIHGQGILNTEQLTPPPAQDVTSIQDRLKNKKEGSACYAIFKKLGLHYGSGFQGIDVLYYSETEALSRITLPKDESYVLQPGILDSALQTCLGLSLDKEVVALNLPVSVKTVTIYGEVNQTSWCHVQRSKDSKTTDKVISYDVDLLSVSGDVLLSFKKFVALPIDGFHRLTDRIKIERPSLQLYTYNWNEEALINALEDSATNYMLILAGASASLAEKLGERLEQEVIAINETGETDYFNQVLTIVQSKISLKEHTQLVVLYRNTDFVDYGFVSALLKTVSIENPKLTGKTIGVDNLSVKELDTLAALLQRELGTTEVEVRYKKGKREIRDIKPLLQEAVEEIKIKKGGVYLITGGAGGLGKLFAKYISKTEGARLILTGRSEKSKLKKTVLKDLNASYLCCDVTDKESVVSLIGKIIKTYGKLDGIIHSAGVIRDGFLIKKTKEDSMAVLNPKIIGAKHLDQTTKDLPLDFTIYFSSLAAVIGNTGQADYASANAWLDNFASYRNDLERKGKRFGKTLSINWPLWEEGGMQLDTVSKRFLQEQWGLYTLPTDQGIIAFEQLLASGISQGIVTFGTVLFNGVFVEKEISQSETATPEGFNKGKGFISYESLLLKIKEGVERIFKIPNQQLQIDKDFAAYGGDSILFMKLVRHLNSNLSISLTAPALFEYQTIRELTNHILEEHSPQLKKDTFSLDQSGLIQRNRKIKRGITAKINKVDYAIVAASGRFTSANTVEDLWHRIELGTPLDLSSTNISPSHLSYGHLTSTNYENGLPSINLDAGDLSKMSIQEKLVFEVLTEAMANYGWDKEDLSSQSTGVFIAAQQVYLIEEDIKGRNPNLAYLIPNKVSFYLNLEGPSEVVNTYCTSGYVAIHRAIQSMASGECSQAIVGGVNVISPREMSIVSESTFNTLTSKNGKTRSFCDDAEGYVRSEGAGIIIIKPLWAAQNEGNQILGIIKGSSVFHGGKNFSIEAPSARGIKKAIESSLIKSGIEVDTIDYIEAHGIASPMADAIELTAIDSVYKKHAKNPDKKWHVGSIKPTIGHPELASGLASIIKVLKAFEHKTIPGIPGLGNINSELPPNHSLILSKDHVYWENGNYPRRAALNSYSVGGVNAHIILEEYVDKTGKDKSVPKLDKYQAEKAMTVPVQAEILKKEEVFTYREEVLAIARTIFRMQKADLNLSLSPIDYDFDSVRIIAFVRRVNQHFGIDVKMGQVLSAEDFESIFALFETAIAQKIVRGKEVGRVAEASLPTRYPLSEGQKGLWVIQEADPDSTIYNVPIALSLNGSIESRVIYEAAEKLLEAHPILRVTFGVEAKSGGLFQEIQATKSRLEINVEELAEGQQVETIFKQLLHRPFDLSKEVLRLYIRYDTKQGRTYILFVIHHIVIDGTSATLLASKFTNLITRQSSAEPVSLPISRNYFDFVNWEVNYIKSEHGRADLTYWQERLKGNIEKLWLPYDSSSRRINDEQDKEGTEIIRLKGTELAALKVAAKGLRVNLSILLLSIFKVLLYRLSGSEDIIVKLPTAGRPEEKDGRSIGYYINMMLSRTAMSGEQTFADLTETLRSDFISGIDHLSYPYPKLLTELELTKGEGDGLFPVLFNYQNIFDEILAGNGKNEVSLMDGVNQAITDEYTLEIADLKTELIIQLKYRTDLFSSATIQRHVGYYQNIMTKVIADPQTRINDISVLSETEKYQLLYEFNDTKSKFPADKTLIDLFEEQVKKTPDNIAVVFDPGSDRGKELTYHSLNEKANKVGHYLREKYSIQPDDIIALQLERSEWMIIAILGVMKAGAAYLPITPDFPRERVEFMLTDSQAKVLLTDEPTFPISKELGFILPVLAIEKIKSRKKRNPDGISGSHNLAYIIYTSGSTGQPKGIMIEQRALVNFLVSMGQFPGIEEQDILLSITNYTFDISILEIGLPLINGAQIVLASSGQQKNPNLLQSLIERTSPTLFQATPSLWSMLFNSHIQGLKQMKLLCGGEALSEHLSIKLLDSGREVWNMYGPTETAIWSGVLKLEKDQGISIGKPIKNTTMYILDSNLDVLPIGLVGELHIGGEGLARGYLNNPELTLEKFIPHPFNSGEQLYKTGDLARWLPDGNIDFLGRIDHQLKIRGHRIEPGEIEQTLIAHDSIHEALVMAFGTDEDKELVAYYVPSQGSQQMVIEPEVGGQPKLDLRSYLRKFLPGHMIPSVYVKLEKMPLTPSGKVNRKALPRPSLDITVGRENYTPPQTPVETSLVALWEDILQRKGIGIHDHFFDLGGHSLRAIRLISLIQQNLNANISLLEIFSNPTIAALSNLIIEKDPILFQLILPIPLQENYALSNAQRRLWVLDQMEELQIAYNVPLTIRLEGKLDREALQSAFNWLVTRHESLRTTFVSIEGTPQQIVNDDNSFEVSFTEWLPENSPEQLADYILAHAQTPFDLINGPLFKVEVICLKEDEHVMLFNMYHIISDGWSIEVLIRELGILYEACTKGERNPLAPLRIQYKDYAAWQNDLLQDSMEMEALRTYWRNKLIPAEGSLATLDLPTDFPRPAIKTYCGASLSKTFDVELLSKLEALSKTSGATLFMTLTALVKVLLYRYSGQRDILIGSLSAGRMHADLQDQIGYYLNVLVLRDEIEEGINFIDFLSRVKQTCLEAFERELYPFDYLVEELDLARDMSRTPLFDVMLVLQNNEYPDLTLGDLAITPELTPLKVSKFDLTFNFIPSAGGLGLDLEYNTDLYKAERIERLVEHLECLMKSVIVDSNQAIDELNILAESERKLILHDFNDTRADLPKDKTIINLFEKQVEKTPDHIAVVFEDRQLTYRQLNKKANKVGHYLRDICDIQPDDIIALQLERSEWMIIAILGVIKSGAAYLPIAPDTPKGRVAHMLKDSQAKILLTDEVTYAAAKELENFLTVLQIEKLKTKKRVNPIRISGPQDLAYIIFTSGSTGKPKGAMVEHLGMLNHVLAKVEAFDINENCVTAFTAPYTFDISVWQIVSTLITGARVVVYSQETILNPTSLLGYLRKDKVNILQVVPSYLLTLIETSSQDAMKDLTYVSVTGEAVSKQLLEQWFACYPDIPILNAYGPTEASDDVTHYLMTKAPERINVPIGKPLRNFKIYIVGSNGSLCPIGVSGELWVAGPGVGRGYINDLEKTKVNFIWNPFVEEKERLYKTGDLASWLPDGNIEFLGRLDHQLKIRGYRIEAGEIEEALLQHPDIQSCVVIGKELENGKELVAYLVSKKGTIPDVITLRNFLSESLLDYMIPAYFVELETLPLTKNGKVNRKALPEPNGLGIASGEVYVPPRNNTEQALVNIWEELLKRERVSIHDNFFDLGGHSLRAIRLVSLVKQQLSAELKLSEVFAQPSISGLASLITTKDTIEFAAIEPVAIQPDYALSHGQRRLWVLDQMEENQIAYNLPTAIRLEGKLNKETLRSAFKLLVDRHESLRTTFALIEGVPRQIITTTDNFEILFTNWQSENNSDLAGYISTRIQEPFDLTKGPLLKVEIVSLEEEKHIMIFNMHHIISDGWSMEVLVKELGLLYNSCAKEEMNPLAPLRIQYKDYAAWQNALLRDNAGMEALRNYWRDKLLPTEGGGIPTLDLPADYPRPAVKTYRGASISKTFDAELLYKLEALGKSCGATLFMTLTALVKVLLYRYSGQRDVLIGSPSAGRTHADLKEQIGFYINTLVLRDEIDEGTNFIDFLTQVKQTCLEAFEHELYPFDQLVEELDLTRDMSRSPLFDIMLVLHNNEEADLTLGDLAISVEPTSWEISKFDLTFNFATSLKGLTLDLEYDTDLYKVDRIDRLFNHLECLIESVVANTQQAIETLTILPEAERQLILYDFNDTQADFPRDKTIIDLFEEKVEITPDKVALIFENQELTYQQLNKKANKVGHYLKETYSIQPDDIVALQLERSEWMVIAILGVMKAGAAYLPIAPDFPKSRVEFMLEDSQAKVLLTDEATYPAAKELESILPVLAIEKISKRKWINPIRINSSQDLAYVIYTSGSTGQPKGVMIEHQALMNFLVSMGKSPGIKAQDVLLSITNYTFDISILEIGLPLINGAQLVLAPSIQQKNPELLQLLIEKTRPSVIQATPSFWSILLNSKVNGLSQMKLLCGGERLSQQLSIKLLNSGKEIWNMYGPTETTIWSSVLNLKENQNLSIGKPITNTSMYILDKGSNLLPIGIAGELYIGGSGLARGYLNNPLLTQEKFVAHPFNEGERIYKTGDLARWLPDGNIEFLGRIDYQLKIRGYRIEAGEIEQALLQHSDIQSCVVIGKEFENNKELIAYLAGKTETIPDVLTLRSFLNESLPDYMIPAYFIALDALPLTNSGKVNRKALPEPDILGIASAVAYVPPRNKTEQALVNIWEELLKRESISVHDNFFDLGGHSLRAIRLVSLVQQQLSAKIKLSEVFARPTIAGLANSIINKDVIQFEAIGQVAVQPDYALSNAQRRLWVINQMEEGQFAYNMPTAIRLKGTLDKEAFQAAFKCLVNRHESLRTTFVSVEGTPRQIVAEGDNFEVTFTNWRPEKSSEQLADYITGHAQRPFDLVNGPLLKVEIVCLEEEEQMILFNMHHIISDGWSIEILVRELGILYEACANEEMNPLPPLRLQYKDYAAWQNALLEENAGMEELRKYWYTKLVPAESRIPTLDLPVDYPRPAIKTYRGASLSKTFDIELLSKLETLGKSCGATLFMTLTALVKVLLYRYSGQRDILIGSPSAGRMHADLQDQIGYYLNTLVLRDEVEEGIDFSNFLTQVKQTCLEAFEHELYPFDHLVEELDLARDMSRSPLFDVMLVLQNNEQADLTLGDLTLSMEPASLTVSKFDMTFNFATSINGLTLDIEYNTDLYKADRMARLFTHLECLIQSVLANSRQAVAELNILPEVERQTILHDFNDTKADFPSDKTIIDLFEEQVEKTPDNIAIVFQNKELTYRQLNEKANQLGNYLIEHHEIQPDDIIALQLERSEWMIIAILGVMKAGGAYLPIAPDYPESRVEYMLKDSSARLLLTDDQTYEIARIHKKLLPVIAMEEASHRNSANPDTLTNSRNLAYIIYTSGSTGQPKGTMLEHRGAVNMALAQIREFRILTSDRILQFATYTFDASVYELLMSFFSGACLVLAKKEAINSPTNFLVLIKKYQVSIITLPPVFLATLEQQSLSNIKVLITAGENPSLKDALHYSQELRYFNAFGPTECSVCISIFEIPKVYEQVPSLIPIGRPIGNTSLYILDHAQCLLPIGVKGELYVSGAGLARGYLNNPEITAEKFIPHLFKEGERMYKTGDLARWLPDGNIEFLGRMDNQLKIRGYRIEAGEIEQVLLQHPDIQSCVVFGREVEKSKELVAYLVGKTETIPSVLILRSFLSESLPDYMIPAYFVELESIPLTSSGKVNRKDLPDPDGLGITSGVAYVKPRNQTEQLLVNIWEEILKRENIGIYDNFFDVGGHSLRAIRLVSVIQKQFNAEIKLTQIFGNPTISSLADIIKKAEHISLIQDISLPSEDQDQINEQINEQTIEEIW